MLVIGGNDEVAAWRAGINVKQILASAFMLCSILAILADVFAAAHLASAGQQASTGDVNINAIAAAVIGGCGSAWSALLGVMVIIAISNRLTSLNPSLSLRCMITGAVFAIAVIIDSLVRQSRASYGRV